jgi:glycosyltransferase involved in cell wall biosynthesis
MATASEECQTPSSAAPETCKPRYDPLTVLRLTGCLTKMNGAPHLPADVVMTPKAADLHTSRNLLRPGYDNQLDLTVFVSCYNEKPYIIETIDTVRAALAELTFSYEIIVIDDCSQDSSADVIVDYMRANPNERIILRRNKVNIGWAQNFLDAAFLGRGTYYRVVCGDASEPKSTMLAVFSEIGAADIIIPYYTTNGGRGWHRGFLSDTYVMLVNIISGFRLKYYNGLPLHVRHNVMRWHSNTRGFGFQSDIICLLLEQGFTFKEVPVYAVEKKGKKSTALTFKNILSICHTLFDLGIRRLANWVYRK